MLNVELLLKGPALRNEKGAGRPKGSKTRPKWMLDALKKAPKRPVGRPKGPAHKKPDTLDALLEVALTYKSQPRPPKPPKKVHKHEPYLSKLKREDPDKLREIVMAGARTRRPNETYKVAGRPSHMTTMEWAVCLDEAQKLARKILKNMDAEGALPTNPIAKAAMEQAIVMLSSDLPAKDKLGVIRTILEWNLAKPAATNNINVKTAEDFLDELASDT
jgi:hypothetical protein